MAGKPKPMSMVKQILLLHQQGLGRKSIARILGISKNTLRSYLDKLPVLLNNNKYSSTTIEDLVKLPEPKLEARFHVGNPAYKDDRFDLLKDKLNGYLKELDE